ncbi:MAG TPA: 30S ribosomal protein S2 [Candidatus Saccharimonadia bacterium]|nr:30S ribosomal protein S2 [Candidatus Saccharimonadia bacterium]
MADTQAPSAQAEKNVSQTKPVETKETTPSTMKTVSIDVKELLEAGSHFGHQSQRWSPKIAPYIYATRNGVHIFDLFKTAEKLKEAAQFAYELGKNNKTLVFVGSKRQAQEIVKEEAIAAGALFVAIRWMGGTITNWDQIQKSITKLANLKKDREEGTLEEMYTKRERVLIDKDINRLERFFGGIAPLKTIPDALFVVDITKEAGAVKEAAVKNVPVIAIVDSNANPTLVDYPIPANDDAVRSIKVIVHIIAQAYKEGKSAWQK